MTLHWANEVLANSTSFSINGTREGLVSNTPLVLQSTYDVTNLMAGTCVCIIYAGRVFYYDATDTTSAHDGLATLVSAEGRRYKTETVTNFRNTVLDKDTATPPTAPSLGDSYLIPAAPTGVWATKTKNIAVYTLRGWVFVAPFVGMQVYVQDEDAYYRYTNAATWVAGLGSASLSGASLFRSALQIPFNLSVENDTTNAPPTVVNGTAYIIGPSPTGAWAGLAGKIVIGESGAWAVYTPVEGTAVFNKALGYQVFYKSGVWQVDRATGKYIAVKITGMTPVSVAPITSTTVASTVTHACAKSTNVLKITIINPQYTALSGSPNKYGIRKDTESNWRLVWDISTDGSSVLVGRFTFYHVPGDTASHDYKLYNVTCQTIILEELEV